MAGLGTKGECIAYQPITASKSDTMQTKQQIYQHNVINKKRCNK